jgi:hypothetical protein
MAIVTNRPPRRKRARQPVGIKASQVVQHTPRERAWRLKKLEPETEAEARVAEFFDKMIQPQR